MIKKLIKSIKKSKGYKTFFIERQFQLLCYIRVFSRFFQYSEILIKENLLTQHHVKYFQNASQDAENFENMNLNCVLLLDPESSLFVHISEHKRNIGSEQVIHFVS